MLVPLTSAATSMSSTALLYTDSLTHTSSPPASFQVCLNSRHDCVQGLNGPAVTAACYLILTETETDIRFPKPTVEDTRTARSRVLHLRHLGRWP